MLGLLHETGRTWSQTIFGLRSLVGLPHGDDGDPTRFGTWLPYLAYMENEGLFRLAGRRLGFVLEAMPQSGADQAMIDVLASLYANCKAGTGIQINLFGSPHVRDVLVDYANLRPEDEDQFTKSRDTGRPVRNSNLYRRLARHRFEHLQRGTQRSLTAGYYCGVRDFRLLISVNVDGTPEDRGKCDDALCLRDAMSATLRAASMPNIVFSADDLINWCAALTNPDRLFTCTSSTQSHDEGREIRDQIVDFDTVQEALPDRLRFSKPGAAGELDACFLSVKAYPKQFPLWRMGALIGDLMQPALQFDGPFMLTLGVHVLDANEVKTAITGNHMRATQNAESKLAKVMPDVERKRKDWSAAADASDEGASLVSMYHQLGLFTHPDQMTAATETAKAIWRARGFTLNADVYMHRQALLASLPMTLSPSLHEDLKRMRRVSRKLAPNAIHLAPVIGEWRGTKTPVLIGVGRRGQVIKLDLYDNEQGNYNAAVAGTSGSGKSTLLQEMTSAYLSIGAHVSFLDLGRSTEKLCRKANGCFVEFCPDANPNLNPFTHVIDIHEDMDMLVPAISKMCSRTRQLEEVQYKAISKTILSLWSQYGRDMTVTALRDRLVSGTIRELGIESDQRVRDLAVMLNPFCRGGQYERFFEGRNNIDLSNPLVVIETEWLKRKPDLQVVASILLLYQITGQMYLTRNSKKLLIVDELKQQLADTGQDDPVLAAVLDEASRRARKYGGGLVTATQDGDDYYGSVQMEAAFKCADWIFLLRQKPESINLLAEKKRLCIDEAKKRLLNSLRKEDGAYSEMYVSSPVGEGIMRLVLDPATHLLFSNRLEDNKPIDELRRQGHSIDEAIEQLLLQRGLA
ncbi:type IV secretion system protein TraC [Massilia sp. YMA4]|uniref:Type IV secretion system protein TraC n=1 Tax=[Empedobacter] haloabium TaxID=592317 RepID=A0ABZ1URJ9_9BURK|nr:type IV secretion system protein TraC [Massilia sp. YMA4]AXA91341.1 type IV secretion system protein TraC [Massilia sp. YMA4]